MIPLKAFQQTSRDNAVEILSSCIEDLKRLDRSDNDFKQKRRFVISEKGCILFEAPTGIGKTLMMGKSAEGIGAKHKILWIWLAPFKGVIEQTKQEIKANFPGLQVRSIDSEREINKIQSGNVFVTTWSNLAMANAESRSARKDTETQSSFDNLIEFARNDGFAIGAIIDEAHHSFKEGNQSSRFYSMVLDPDITILSTATPKDKDIGVFEEKTKIRVNRITISRQQGVDAGLLKRGIKVGLFRVKNHNDEKFVDFEHTALQAGIEVHRKIKQSLNDINAGFTPLLLVQATDNDSIERIKGWALNAGFSEGSISVHTSDEPDPYLETIAYDDNIEILIFKLAVATGFNAPRAFTLVSFRTSRDADFGTQIIGRIMRVHKSLQPKTTSIPEALMHGYVFLANKDGQEGLMSAAQRINAIKDELAQVSGRIAVLPVSGLISKQAQNGQSELVFTVDSAENDTDNGAAQSASGTSSPQVQLEFTADFFTTETWQQNNTSTNQSNDSSFVAASTYSYPIGEHYDGPANFKTARLGLNTQGIIDDAIISFFEINSELLAIAQKEAIAIYREDVELFSGKYENNTQSYAYLLEKEISKRGQAALMDVDKDGMIDIKRLQAGLENRLRKAFEEAGNIQFASDPSKIRAGLFKILALKKSRLDEAVKRSMLRYIEVADAAPIPTSIESDIELIYSRRNIYGILPSDLGSWEKKFASWLDSYETQGVKWWHRNPDRKAYSVAIPIPGRTNNFYPDFIIGVEGRDKEHGILLIDTKERINDEEGKAVAKINAQHPVYGKAVIIYLEESKEGDSKWYTVRYVESRDKNELDQILHDELLKVL